MNIADIMRTDFKTLRGRASLDEAEEIMNQQGLGLIPVRRDGKVVGLVSRLDLLNGIVEHPHHERIRVRDVMRRELPCCYLQDDLDKVAEYMVKRNQRYLLVIGRDYQLRGIVSRSAVQAGISPEADRRPSVTDEKEGE